MAEMINSSSDFEAFESFQYHLLNDRNRNVYDAVR